MTNVSLDVVVSIPVIGSVVVVVPVLVPVVMSVLAPVVVAVFVPVVVAVFVLFEAVLVVPPVTAAAPETWLVLALRVSVVATPMPFGGFSSSSGCAAELAQGTLP